MQTRTVDRTGVDWAVAGPRAAPRGGWLRPLVIIPLLVVTAALAYRAPVLPLLDDSQHYFYMGERAASGLSPCAAHFDPKSALSMLLSGAAMAIGRLAGIPDVVSARLLSVVALAVSLALMWRLCLLLTASRRAALLGVLILVAMWGYVFLAVMGGRPKIFVVLFTLGALCAEAEDRPFSAAVSAAMAFLCWQPALLMTACLFVARSLGTNRPLRAGHLLAGTLLPVALYEAYFALTGSLDTQLVNTGLFPARYMSHAFQGFGAAALDMRRLWFEGNGRFNALPLVCAVGVAGAAWRVGCQGARGALARVRSSAWLYAGGCAAACSAFTFYEHQGYPDLFLLLPFIGLIGAATLEAAARAAGRHGSAVVAVAGLYLALLAAAGPVLGRFPTHTLREQQALGVAVGEMLARGERVYAVGCTHLLAFNHAANWLPYGFFFRGVDRFLADRSGPAGFTPVRDGRWPSVVLLSRQPPRGASQWLRSHYVEVTPPAFARQSVRVFRLVAASAGAGPASSPRESLPAP